MVRKYLNSASEAAAPAASDDDSDLDAAYGPSVNSPLLGSDSPGHLYGSSGSSRDSFHAALLLFFLLGIGSLLPWNFFTTAKSYFDFKFRNTSADGLEPSANGSVDPSSPTYLQLTFENYLAVFSNLPNIVFMLINAVVTKYIGQSVRMVTGLSLMIAVFTATCVFVTVDTDSYQAGFFWGTMLSVVAVNIGAALVQGSLFGLAAMFPHRYVKALMQGQASGGVIAALVFIASLGLGSNPQSAGLLYFVSATSVLVLCLLAYLALRRLPFVREHVSRSETLVVDVPDFSPTPAASGTGHWRRALSDLTWPGLAVFLVFAMTLSLYPALLSSVASLANPNSLFFTPLACFLAFNASDLVGRSLTGIAVLRGPRSARLLVLLALLRFALVPLFLLCNYRPRRQTGLPLVLTSDAALPILVCLFGLSNGYLGTLCMTRGNGVAPAGSAETYGALMSFFLTFGLGAGSGLSFIFTTLL